MLRVVGCLLGLWIVLGAAGPWARADDDDPLGERIGRLLQEAGAEGQASEDAQEALDALGWEKVLPHIDMEQQRTVEARSAALDLVARIGRGEGIYTVCLQAMRCGEEGIALRGIDLLNESLRPWQEEGQEPVSPLLEFDPAWWPVLLRELHNTSVFIVETFYSGPGWPASNLTELLAEHVHGHEAHLVKATGHDDWRVRMMAVPLLGVTRTGRTAEVRSALGQAVVDKHPKVRQMAVRTVMSAEWLELYPAVVARAKDVEETLAVRLEAFERYVGGLRDEESLPLVMELVVDPNAGVRSAAAEAVSGWRKPPALVRALLKMLLGTDPAFRVAAAKGLRRPHRGDVLGPDVPVDPLHIKRLLKDPSPLVQMRACEILAERGAVPDDMRRDLIQRLTAEDARPSVGAAIALGSLRARAKGVLPAMRLAMRHLPTEPDRYNPRAALEEAIEAVDMASQSAKAVDRLVASSDADHRLRGLRELIRRDDTEKLTAALDHADPEIVVRAAAHLVSSEPHTEQVVDATLRVFDAAKHYTAFHVFHELGDRLDVHVSKVLAWYRKIPTKQRRRLLLAVEALRPRVWEMFWARFRAIPGEESASHLAEMGDVGIERVIEALRSKDPALRRGAAFIVKHMSHRYVCEHAARLYALPQQMAIDDAARHILQDALTTNDCPDGLGPMHPWIELR